MKKNALIFTYLLSLTMTLLSSCDKLPNDSTLDGFWQVLSATHDDVTYEIKENKSYWCFRLNLLQLTAQKTQNLYAHTEHKGDSLFLYDFSYNSENANLEDNNEWITSEDTKSLNYHGIFPENDSIHSGFLSAKYRIVTSSDDKLILENESSKIILRRF